MYPSPGFEGLVLDTADRTDPGVVDEDIEFSETIPYCLDRLLPTALAADVLLECHSPVETIRVNCLRCLPGPLYIDVSQDNVRTFPLQCFRCLGAQTLRGSGNKSDFIFNTTHAI